MTWTIYISSHGGSTCNLALIGQAVLDRIPLKVTDDNGQTIGHAYNIRFAHFEPNGSSKLQNRSFRNKFIRTTHIFFSKSCSPFDLVRHRAAKR